MNLYGHFIQLAGDLRGQWVYTLRFLSSLPFYNRKQSAVRDFGIQGKLDEKTAVFSPWAVSCSQGWVVFCLSLEHHGYYVSSRGPRRWSSAVPQEVNCLSREPGWALWGSPETIALTYALPTRLINCLP